MMGPMQVTHTATYDAPLSLVHAMLLDPAFRRFAAARSGVLEVDVTVEERGTGHVVTIDQLQPTQGVPAFAKKFAGESTRAVQVEEWESPSRCRLSVDTPGRPTEVRGSYALSEADGRTTQVFTGEVKASVPLIGGKLEKLIGDLFTQGRDVEARSGNAWLAGER